MREHLCVLLCLLTLQFSYCQIHLYPNNEDALRSQIFKDNEARAKELNEKFGVRVFGVTKFSNLTSMEFMSQRLGLFPALSIDMLHDPQSPDVSEWRARAWRDPSLHDGKRTRVSAFNGINWVERGAVTPPKDQGSAGTCWAFSCIENIESQWYLAGNPLEILSAEQAVDCDYNDCGIAGGWAYRCYEYVIAAGGL